MPAKYRICVGDLMHWRAAQAHCAACGHKRVVSLKRFGRWDRLVDLEKKLRCTRCGNRGVCWFAIGPNVKDN